MTKQQITDLLWLQNKADAITKSDFINAIGPDGVLIETDKDMSLFLGAYRAVMNSSGEIPYEVPVTFSAEFKVRINQLIHNIGEAISMHQVRETLQSELKNLLETMQKMIDDKTKNQPEGN